MKFIALCFLISLLVLFNTKPLQGLEPETVFDNEGNPLLPGEGYYVFQLGSDNGGITLGHIRNKTCPLAVTRNPEAIGSPVFFSASGIDYIPSETNLTIEIPILGTPCNEPKIWKFFKVGANLWFVGTGGRRGDLASKFKIVRLRVEVENAFEIYRLYYCPVRTFCAPLGFKSEADGTLVLAAGDGIEPYNVRFQKVSTFVQKKNQDLSSM